jgi:hypothetical protein
MGLSDWMDLELLSRKLADAQGRLARARSTQNHGLVQVLEKEIAAAEGLREQVVSHIAVQLTSSPQSTMPRDPPGSDIVSASPKPAPLSERAEGVDIVWQQLTRADLERVKRELDVRRSEMLARHAEELRALDADKAEIDIVEQTIEELVRKFNIGSAEVLPLQRPTFSQAG